MTSITTRDENPGPDEVAGSVDLAAQEPFWGPQQSVSRIHRKRKQKAMSATLEVFNVLRSQANPSASESLSFLICTID